VLWDSRVALGIWESFAFMSERSSFLAALRAREVAIGDSGVGSGGGEEDIGMLGVGLSSGGTDGVWETWE
jgi:hypothetical protein